MTKEEFDHAVDVAVKISKRSLWTGAIVGFCIGFLTGILFIIVYDFLFP